MLIETALALKSLFFYNVYDYPAIQGKDCEEVVYSLGENLKENYEVSVIETACVWDDANLRPENTWIFKIKYEAQTELNVVSTRNTADILQPETYFTKEECETALAAEVLIFKEKTGLNPFIYFCKPPLFSDGYSKSTWGLVIDSFGQAAKYPYTSVARLSQKPRNKIELDRKILNFYSGKNQDVVQIFAKQEVGLYNISIRYYGKAGLRLKYQNVIDYGKKNECEADSAHLNAKIVSDAYITAVCTEDNTGASLGILTEETDKHRIYKHPNKYEKIEECKAAVVEIIDKYNSIGKNMVAGLCTYDWHSKKYSPVLIERLN